MSRVLASVFRVVSKASARALAGALAGIVLGSYLFVVLEGDAFVHSIDFEEARSRFRVAVILSTASGCALLGALVGAMRLGPWVRDAVYGFLTGVLCVVCGALAIALFRGEQPFHHVKGAPSWCIDIARVYGVPIGAIVGAVAGIWVGRVRRTRKGAN